MRGAVVPAAACPSLTREMEEEVEQMGRSDLVTVLTWAEAERARHKRRRRHWAKYGGPVRQLEEVRISRLAALRDAAAGVLELYGPTPKPAMQGDFLARPSSNPPP